MQNKAHLSKTQHGKCGREGPGAVPLCDGIWGWAHTDLMGGSGKLKGINAGIVHTLHHKQWGNFTEMHPWERPVKPQHVCFWLKNPECSQTGKKMYFCWECYNIVGFGFQVHCSKTAFFLLRYFAWFHLHVWDCQNSSTALVNGEKRLTIFSTPH